MDFDVYIKTYNENKTPHCLSSIKQRTDRLRHQVYRVAVRLQTYPEHGHFFKIHIYLLYFQKQF